jgi:hypothetical protein
MTRRVAALVFCSAIGSLGCGGAQPQPETSSDGSAPSAAAEPPATATGNARPELTAEACEAGGGAVVGDIGDGAVHRADYRCPSGSVPRASIRAPEGGPVAVEGAVCCPK